MKPSPVLGFLCLLNDRFWPLGDVQVHEIMAVRAAAIDPKRTVSVCSVHHQFPKLIAYLG
jgi:hypothetical protein